MLNIGAGEIALIVVVALLVLGPERLPQLARGLGKFMREFRSRTDEVRHVVEREFYRMDEEIQAQPPKQLQANQAATPEMVGRRAVAPVPPLKAPEPVIMPPMAPLPPPEAKAPPEPETEPDGPVATPSPTELAFHPPKDRAGKDEPPKQ
jgi:sec-independent protein translocase protein TatB